MFFLQKLIASRKILQAAGCVPVWWLKCSVKYGEQIKQVVVFKAYIQLLDFFLFSFTTEQKAARKCLRFVKHMI